MGVYAGAPIILDWSVAILAAFLVLSNIAAGMSALPFALITLISILLAIFIHEMGHAATAAAFRIPNRRIVITGFGGFIEPAWKPAYRSQDILISAAGPAANLGCAAIGWVLLRALSPATTLEGFDDPLSFLERFMQVSLALGAFNLLPGFPLDGGHILRVALGYRVQESKAAKITAWLGLIIGAYLGLAGVATQALWATGIGLYIASAALEELRRLRNPTRKR
ncbi:MAG: site-2 protease family protein [Hyphomonadaceae bacterium]|nr:site-2 protease family protein [Hyphomonadaceae bacterium]